mmetsp:Transcript_20517/g.41977  ORF Transcript_20517/g.41977 Transcript_20517/m.41977 type:complete len:209 (-) Transcript_20517:161-787(-)
MRHADGALEVLDDGGGEGERVRLLAHRRLVEAVGDHELGQVAHHLGRGGHLDDVAQQPVGGGVGRLDLRPLVAQAEGGRLELQVGVLATRHLMLIHLCGAGLLARLEGGVREADRLPVLDELVQLLQLDAGATPVVLERGDDGTHGWLRRHSRHRVHRHVHRVGARRVCREHRCDAGGGGVVRVHVDGERRELSPQRADERACGGGLE